MSTTLSSVTGSVDTRTALTRGIIGGLGGGLVFGALMAMMGMLPMVGMLVGQENAAIGFIVHLLISAFIGATFGLLTARFVHGWGQGLLAGAAYGVLWWVLGALILMPLMLGMSQLVLQVGQAQWMSLLGHLLFGVVMGGIFVYLGRR